ncbi:hypothetical protein [Mastigocoleus sp. MO_188.B34]|uniref:hypothetical protein n=1 Tax=Mastigocoleus sp. MO_188.B34 TaxID=3036635 RepID=UPI002605A256|nr:hypothetical protein [Mastigocoleus sp. MO_188.B34]MDJ0697021.1 hypothetical protein [Mastigocoleus sp. MO_188.B34]
MKKILFLTSFVALVITLTQGCTQSNARSNQPAVGEEPIVQSQSSSNKQESVTSQNNNSQEAVGISQSSNNKQESVSSENNNNQETSDSSQVSTNKQESVSQSKNNNNNQTLVAQSPSNRNMNISRSSSKSIQSSSSSSGYTSQSSSSYSSSSGYQSSSLTLSKANLSEPHILTVTTSGKRLTGKVIVNDKFVKKLYGNKVEFDLSPHLSVGKNTVEIDARYAPTSSTLDVEVNGPETSVSQQNSGNGVVNSNINIMVR